MTEHAVRTDGADRVIEVVINGVDMRSSRALRSAQHLPVDTRDVLYIRTQLTEAGIPLKPTFDTMRIEPASGRLERMRIMQDDTLQYRWHP